MPDVTFPHERFGLPIRDNYSIEMDSALARAQQSSGHVRQRRTYLHQASVVNLTLRMSIQRASDFLVWVRENVNDWWMLKIISGNDRSAQCPVEAQRVKLASTIQSTRIPYTSNVQLSFTVEVHSLRSWELLSSAPLQTTFPKTLPLPMATGFSTTHGPRGATQFALTWRLTAAQLKDFIAFASYSGTSWFRMPMISPNVPCGLEVIRFTTGISQSLAEPGVFEVSVNAESLLDYIHPAPTQMNIPPPPIPTYSAVLVPYNSSTVPFNG